MTTEQLPTHEPAPAPSPEEGIDVRALLGVLQRRRWIAVSAFAACVAIGIFVTVRAPRIYLATTTVVIDRNAPEVLSGVREVYDLGTGNYWASKEYYETQYNLIRSRPVAQRTLGTLGISTTALAQELKDAGETSLEGRLTSDPLHGLSPEARARISDKLALLGLTAKLPREKLIETLEKMDPVSIIQGMIKVSPVKESHLVRIQIENTNPEVAARIANAVASAYSEVNLDQKVDLTRSAVDWLRDQVADLKTKLESSELALHEFKKENNIVSASMEDRQTMIAQTLSELNNQLSQATAKRIATESRRDQIQRVRDAGLPPDAVEEVLTSQLIQSLKSNLSELRQEQTDNSVRYTGEHPKQIALAQRIELAEKALAEEITKVLRTLEDQYQTAADTETRLKQAIEDVKTEALELNKKEIEYSRLSRERDNNKNLYNLVINRQKEADLTQMLRVNNVRQLEAALVPAAPIRPSVRMNLAVALVLGLLLGVALAFAVDFLDNTLKTQEQVERLLALPLLGLVPAIKLDQANSNDDSGRDHYILAHPRSSVAECCRTVRTNLMFMSPDTPARSLLVTSSGPREGKSTMVVNLAITMAQSGARTLIIDTDMRRPRLHKSFRVPNDVGMSNLILGEVELERATQSTGIDRVDIITCGPIPPNPAELLHTEAFAKLIERLKQKYDRVIFDSPPVGAVTDAQVLSSMMDGVVLVVHAGKTSWQAARQAKRRLTDVGARLFGVVLNNVDLDDKRSGHYYEYAYYGTYGEDEKKAPVSA